jgi:hypothetical protein
MPKHKTDRTDAINATETACALASQSQMVVRKRQK